MVIFAVQSCKYLKNEAATRHLNDQYGTPDLGLIAQKLGANSHCVKNREGQSAPPSRIGVITTRYRRAGAFVVTVGRPLKLLPQGPMTTVRHSQHAYVEFRRTTATAATNRFQRSTPFIAACPIARLVADNLTGPWANCRTIR
jgi:hypothetical protein